MSNWDVGSRQMPARQATFKRNGHIKYFLLCLRALPSAAQGHDPNRITIAFFCLSGLDILGALEEQTSPEQRRGWAEWIWSLQSPSGGFRGSTFMTTDDETTSPGHLPSTYTALLCLALLRAPLDRLDKKSLGSFLAACQAPDGSFAPLPAAHEGQFQNDARMSYCATAICSFIDDYQNINVPLAMDFVRRCQTWEGGYAARPGLIEAQGGTTYCCITTLYLLSRAHTSPSMKPTAISLSSKTITHSDDDYGSALRWLVQRQIGGFQGRPGKLEDVCYSFWCGAAISVINSSSINLRTDDIGPWFVSPDRHSNTAFLLSSQSPMGGFGKEPEDYPDPFHSYLALAAMAIPTSLGGPVIKKRDAEEVDAEEVDAELKLGLKEVDPVWNVTLGTKDWLIKEMRRLP